MTKYCNVCKTHKQRSEFGHNAARYDKLQSQCLSCRAAKVRAKRRGER